ncbi:MAG: hypothetical protein Kow00123_14790 [Anaerolineales bacterium]
MKTEYHRQITRAALAPYFTDSAVEVAVRANDAQDGLKGQVGHAEYHVDNAIPPAFRYLQEQQRQAVLALQRGDCEEGMRCLGRALHTVQDFYSHTTYVRTWLRENNGQATTPDDIPPLLDWLSRPDLATGRAVFGELLTFLPVVGPVFARIVRLPADSHFHQNLDGPHRGPEFAYVLAAARKHSDYLAHQVWMQVRETAPAPPACLRPPQEAQPHPEPANLNRNARPLHLVE